MHRRLYIQVMSKRYEYMRKEGDAQEIVYTSYVEEV